MNREFDFASWYETKDHLKMRYPVLTKSDLTFRHGTKDDLLQMISRKLGKTKKELEEEIETALSENFE
jgi:hypothetical protein